jgi:hypothetical protein
MIGMPDGVTSVLSAVNGRVATFRGAVRPGGDQVF